MSILGLGYDLVELTRIRCTMNRFGKRFLRRCFTEGEIRFCFQSKDPVPSLATRYAAKEACSKALGTGITRGISWKQIEIRRSKGGPPIIHLHGRAHDRATELGVQRAHVSLTHGQKIAGAVIVLEDNN